MFVRHPNEIVLSLSELKMLYEYLEHQYISYENIQLIELVRAMRKIVDELVTETGRTT